MKTEKRLEAIRLRGEGKSLREICNAIGAAKSSVSNWVRNVNLTEEQKINLRCERDIDKNYLCQLVSEENDQRRIAQIIGVSQSCIRRNLKEHGLQTSRMRRLDDAINTCRFCGKQTKNRQVCGSCRTKIRRIRTKWAAIKLKGGKCENCKMNASVNTMPSFEFHHIHGKDFTIGSTSNKSWDAIKKEISKCMLLCSNCHRITHGQREENIMRYAIDEYNGRNLEL